MTAQEQQLLMQLTQRINQTQLQEKDPDAENLLGRELGANPDALYIMAQTVLVQNMALEQLKGQAAQLQQQLQQARQQQPAHSTSFLGRLFGDKEGDKENDQSPPPPPPRPQYQSPQAQYQQPPQQGWQPVPNYQQAPPPQQYGAPQYGQPQYGQPQYGQPQYVVPAGQPSFLRGAMQTAAGVAAGALAFEGIESLMHGFGHGGGWSGPGMAGFGVGPAGGFGGGFERPVEETVINNYYDQPGPIGSGDSRLNDRLEHDFGSGEHRGQDVGNFGQGDRGSQFGQPDQLASADYTGSGPNEDAGAFDQGAYDNGMENDTAAADNSVDDVQIDDSGSGFDDGSSGGFDDGGGLDDGGFDSGGDDSGF